MLLGLRRVATGPSSALAAHLRVASAEGAALPPRPRAAAAFSTLLPLPLPPLPPLLQRCRALCSSAAAPEAQQLVPRRDWSPSSRRVGVVGMKCGMTHDWSASGVRVPITVVELQDVQVSKVRERMHDGVDALQLAGGWQKRKRLRKDDARQYESRGLPLKRC